ncbi:MAG TPA: phytanoyl-CoA dioxygenase family protein [Actinopolymorphaceae bacterium]
MTTTIGPTKTTPFLDSSPLLDDPDALRRRADEHGYLFVRGLLPAETVLDLRWRFLEVLARHGWLRSDRPLMDGRVDRDAFEREDVAETEFCGVGVTPAAYRDVQRVRQFHELSHHPRLLRLYEALFDGPVFPHPRNIARLMIPRSTGRPTPPHQDFIHIQGTPRVWTAWFPLGACPRELGGLTVLDGSHRDGLMSYRAAEGAGGLEAYLCNLDLTWAQGDFEPGDVLTFSSHTVHKALPNGRPDLVRLSCDFRYQPLRDEIEERSLDVHCGVLDWDKVYAGWPDGGIQYYWREHTLPHSEWDESIRWQKDKIC